MPNKIITFNISLKTKEKLQKELKNNIIFINNNYIEIAYKIFETTIIIYKTQKCVLQGKNTDQIVNKYFYDDFKEHQEINCELNQFNVIGSDEVGVGDYFGGLVVCAAYVNSNNVKQLIDLGIKDSKKITDDKIFDIAEKITKIIPYRLMSILPKQYNDFYKLFHNTHTIKTLLHYECIKNLNQDVKKQDKKIDYFVIDQYATKKNFVNYLNQLEQKKIISIDNELNENLTFMVKAESKIVSVAAASILARAAFLKQNYDLSKKYEIILPLGANPRQIYLIMQKIIKKYDLSKTKCKDFLLDIAKLHFRTTDEILNDLFKN